jgi:hypothetical protein
MTELQYFTDARFTTTLYEIWHKRQWGIRGTLKGVRKYEPWERLRILKKTDSVLRMHYYPDDSVFWSLTSHRYCYFISSF